MLKNTLPLTPNQRKHSIVMLNVVSLLAQFGQYGLGTTLIPIGLKIRNASAESIGATSSALWIGMLIGLLVAGHLTRVFGYRITLIAGISLSAFSFVVMPLIDWGFWLIPAALIGLGMGLRWIALETWLYCIVPEGARGRVVGIHEALLATAAFLGPLMMIDMTPLKPAAFWIAALVMLSGFIPLYFARSISAQNSYNTTEPNVNKKQNSDLKFTVNTQLKFWFGFGAVVAGLGGYVEGSLLAFIPVYTSDIGYSAADAAWLLTLFQIGAMVFQFPVGLMADHCGLLKTTKVCAAIASVSLVSAIAYGTQIDILTVIIFMLGGSIASTLSLGIIWAVHQNTGANINSKVKQVSVTYTTLSATGPLITGVLISGTSSSTLFWQQLTFALFLIGFLCWQKEIDQELR